jgi:DNA-binding MarR family transcriptional regulator
LKPYDLTAEQFHVLKSLKEDSGIAQNKLCEAVEKSPANITRILDRLEKKDYLVRRDHPEDRRSTLVYLTAAGGELMAEVRRELADIEAKITAGLSPEQILEMKQGLRLVCRNIEEITGGLER